MSALNNEWILHKSSSNSEDKSRLQKQLNLSDSLVDILIQRKITSFEQAKNFFRPSLGELNDPFLMLNMDQSVQCLEKHIESQNNILVYGDYDVDGTTSVALTYTILQKHNTNVAYYIPDRYEEGYGVSDKGVQFAIDNNISLVITLDCGIKAIDKVKRLRENNIDVIICDHHTQNLY